MSYDIGQVLVDTQSQAYWEVTCCVSATVGRAYVLRALDTDIQISGILSVLVEDTNFYTPHVPTPGDKYEYDGILWEYTGRLPEGPCVIVPRRGSLRYTKDKDYYIQCPDAAHGWKLVGRWEDTTPGDTTPSVPSPEEELTEGDALMAFFGTGPGTWSGYDGERMR